MSAATQWISGFDVCYKKGPPNFFDACLGADTRLWHNIQCRGGITALCRRVEAPTYDAPPWVVQPPQGRRFQEIQTVASPAANTTTAVLAFRVPHGYDGVINGIVCRFIGLGFVEGSGDLHWRLQLSRRYASDYGDIQTSLGDLTAPVALQGGGIRVYSNQLIQFLVYVNVAVILDPAGRVLCALSGWFYPRP